MSSVVEMNPEDLERLLLDENTATAEQLASMKTTLEHLVKKVDSLAARKCHSSRINEECNLIEQELERLNELEHEVSAFKKVVCETLALVLNAKALQSEMLGTEAKQYEKVFSPKVENEATSEQAAFHTEHSNPFHFQPRQHPETGSCGDAPATVYEQLNVSEFDNVEYHLNFDPIAAAQGRLRQQAGKTDELKPGTAEQMFLQPGKTTDLRPKIKGSTQLSSTKYRNPGESHREESQMGCIFAAMALPEVEAYRGRNFEDFMLKFSMKYQNLGLRDDLLNHLLLSKLEGYPKAVAKALPRQLREGNFDNLVEALRAKFSVNASSVQMKAYMDLKRLRKSGDITRYCLELEKLTTEAYPDASEEELSRTRAGDSIRPWRLLQKRRLRNGKAMAQRCERSKQVAIAMQEAYADHTRNCQEGQRRKGTDGFKVTTVQKPVVPQKNISNSNEIPLKKEQGEALVKCYNCNKQGHLKKDCTLPKKSSFTKKTVKGGQQTAEPKVFTASLRKWICGAIEVENKCELVGEQTTTDVRLLGMSRKALLDTGSQISIIPLQMLQTALESGYDLDADVEEVPLDKHRQVFDASGNKMTFKEALKLTLQTTNGSKERVALFVMSGGDDMIVLGTNALQKLGYDLTQQNRTNSSANLSGVEENNSHTSNKLCAKQQRNSNSSFSVTITKRMYIRPGETKSVPIQCEGLTREGIFWSREHLLPDVLWKGGNQALALPITNTFAGAKIFRVGEEVGTFEPTEFVEVEPVNYSGNMLQRTEDVAADREGKLLRLLQGNRTSGEYNEAVEKLVKGYAHVFAVSEQELMQTKLVEHNIETGEATPIRQKARPIPLATRVELRRILNDLQERNIIEPNEEGKIGAIPNELIVAAVAEEPEWTAELRQDPVYADVIDLNEDVERVL
ncbi:zinc knuckle [Ostertagia ostertagi]